MDMYFETSQKSWTEWIYIFTMKWKWIEKAYSHEQSSNFIGQPYNQVSNMW
jgi:hypothetical protein